MKLADMKGEAAIEALGKLLEPLSRIFEDDKIRDMFKENAPKAKFGSYIFTAHKKDILEILAIRDGEDIETYAPSYAEIPAKIIDLLTDEAFVMLFPSLGQNAKEERSGLQSENTEENKE